MAQKTLAGITLEVSDDGYLINPSQWSNDVALGIAKEEGIELTEIHFKVLEYLRQKYTAGDSLTIRAINKSGVVDVKTFYQLFPGAPLKKATKIAGIPKPSSCV